jgi:acetoin utilization protein AcuB
MSDERYTVRNLMTTRLVTIQMDATLQDAQRIFQKCQFHHLIVVEADKPVGVLSDRDLLRHLSPFLGARFSERPQDAATLKTRIHQMMTRRLIAIEPEASATQAALKMMHHHLSCLPVIDADGKLLGIITRSDLLRALARAQAAADLPV